MKNNLYLIFGVILLIVSAVIVSFLPNPTDQSNALLAGALLSAGLSLIIIQSTKYQQLGGIEEIKQLIKECCPCPNSIQKTADTVRNNRQNQSTEVNSIIPSEEVDNERKKQESSKVRESQKEENETS